MNMIDMFEKVKTHLLSMTERSRHKDFVGGSVGCAYRTADGNRCAVGCLIPDELYKEEFETFSVEGLLTNFPSQEVFGFYVTYNQGKLLRELQIIHDYPMNWDAFGLNDRGKRAIKKLEERVKNNEFN